MSAVKDSLWIAWSGGASPVPATTQVRALFRDGSTFDSPAGAHCWTYSVPPNGADIVGYQILPPPAQPLTKTLRDEFAMAAMPLKFGERGTSIGLDEMAKNCYAMADAMLKAREVQP